VKTINRERHMDVRSKKWLDRTGTTNEHGVKFLEFRGFCQDASGVRTSFGAWIIECPRCNRQKEIWSTRCETTQHCGCGRSKFRDKKLRVFWHAMIASTHCGEDWKVWENFTRDVPEIPDGMQLYRPDHRKPLGPDNFILGPKRPHCLWITRIWRSHGRILTVSDIQKLLNCSRQNVWSLKPENLQARIDAAIAAELSSQLGSGDQDATVQGVDVAV